MFILAYNKFYVDDSIIENQEIQIESLTLKIDSLVLFQLLILLIGLCILSSLGVQFYEVTYYNKVDKIRQKHIQEYIRVPDDNYLQVERLPKILALKIFEIMTITLFVAIPF
jgi:hypothetical protein